MAKKLAKKELEEELRRVSSENSMLSQVLHDLVEGVKPSADQVVKVDGTDEEYRFRLFRVTGALAGIVLTEFRMPGQTATIRVDTIDSLVHQYSNSLDYAYWPIRDTVDSMRIQRNKELGI